MKQHYSDKNITPILDASFMVPEIDVRAPQETTSFDYWFKKNSYYHRRIIDFYKVRIPAGASVLMLNCKNGSVLHALKPFFGVGIDTDERALESGRAQYPELKFFNATLETVQLFHRFDYIIVPNALAYADDIQELLVQLHRFCHPGTRIVVDGYNRWWSPLVWCAQKLRLSDRLPIKNWISSYDMRNFLYIAGFESVSYGAHTLLPFYIPLISALCNTIIACLPLINGLGLMQWVVARPMRVAKNRLEAKVSVIITCKNEEGNIEGAVRRVPMMGKETEIIFVEGGSKDNTRAEIARVIEKYPHKNMRLLVQDGTGKGDAVRKGFAHATGDVLMILDGDLTVIPEEMPKFFDALMSGKGEFINGSRLVCGMDKSAMPWLNWVVNRCFGIIVSWITGQKMSDSLCGTKVLFKKDYERIARQRSFFSLHDPFGDFDLIFGAARLHLKIVDLPIHYKPRTYGRPNIQFLRGGILLLLMCWHAMRKLKMR